MVYQGAVTLSKEEQVRYSVIEKFRTGEYTREEAALKLGIGERQVSRIAKKVREQGFKGVLHGNKGRTPWNKSPEKLIDQYVGVYESKYSKFNFQHEMEMIEKHEELPKLSYSVFRRACRSRGLGKVKRRRTSKAKIARERFAEEGFMWQLDGSPHLWDGKETSTLVALIDDATSKIPAGGFYKAETTWACMNVVWKAIRENGVPHFILTDMAGWSTGNGRKRPHFSQFERACIELGITVIGTPSPESKGRIERSFRTAQDRLIPELELYGIRGIENSTKYYNDVYIPEVNEKFAVESKVTTTRYRKLETHIDLKEVFCMKFERIVNRDHTISYGNKRYRIQPAEGKTYKGKSITVHEYEDGSISINYGGKKIMFDEMKEPKRKWVRKC